MRIVHQPYLKYNEEKNCWDWAVEVYHSEIFVFTADTKEESMEIYKKLKGKIK